MNFCTECGNKLTGNEKFCSQCGFDLRVADSSKGTRNEKRESVTPGSESEPEAVITVESRLAKAKDSIKTSKKLSSSSESTRGKALVSNIFVYGLLSILILGPSAYLYKSNMHVMSSLCSLLGGILVFIFPYRKRWKLSFHTTLIPAIAIFAVSFLIMLLIGNESRGGTLNHEVYDYIAQAALIAGPILGIVLGVLRKIEPSEEGVWTNNLLLYLLPWGVFCMLTVGVASAYNAPHLVFACLMGVYVLGSGLPALFLMLCVRRFFVRGVSHVTGLAILLVLSGAYLSSTETCYAQSFSETDKQAFKDGMMPLRTAVAKKLHDQGYWVSWNMSGGLNRNNYDFRTASVLKALITLELGTKNGNPVQSGESIPITVMKFSNEAALAAELKRQQESSMAEAKRDTQNSNFEVRSMDPASGIEVFSYDRVLSGVSHMKQETKRFQLFLKKGNWLVIFPVRKASDRRRTGYMDAIYAIRNSLGMEGDSSVSTLIPVERPSFPRQAGLSNDLLSGRSIGGSPPPTSDRVESNAIATEPTLEGTWSPQQHQGNILDESTLNPEWHGKMGWMDTGFIREHKGSETSGIVSIILLASSFLMGIGASFSVASGKEK